MKLTAVTGVLLVAILLAGDLGAPFPRDEVAFESIERSHFDAFAVATRRGEGGDEPLTVRVHLVGDARDADISRATAWLREHADIALAPDAGGAPLYLTRQDLAATSGRSTLGATVPRGMAVEVEDADVGACVLAHEVLHFVGLRHVDDADNIMYPHCTRGQLATAELDEGQRERLDGVVAIQATTPRGVEAWAYRGS